MLNSEYALIIKRLNLSRAEFAKFAGVNRPTVEARCREGRTRITAKAELEMLRWALARVLRMKISGPAPRIKHVRDIPVAFEDARKPAPRKRVAGKRPAAAPQTCLWVDRHTGARCTKPRENLDHARLCVVHAMRASFSGVGRFDRA